MFLPRVPRRGVRPEPDPAAERRGRRRAHRARADERRRAPRVPAPLPAGPRCCSSIVYFFLTAYRDFRDNYAAEIWADLGRGDQAAVFTLTELPIALSVMVVLGLLYLVKDNRRGLLLTYVIMGRGALLVGVGTLLFDAGVIGPTAVDDPRRARPLPRLRPVRLRAVRSHDRRARHRRDRGVPDLRQRRGRVRRLGRSSCSTRTSARPTSRSCSSSATSRTRRAPSAPSASRSRVYFLRRAPEPGSSRAWSVAPAGSPGYAESMAAADAGRDRVGTLLEAFSNLEPPPVAIDWGAMKRWLTRPRLPMARARARGSWLARMQSWWTLRSILVLAAASFGLSLIATPS